MSLEVGDIWDLEKNVRTEAERLRFEWPDSMLVDPAVPADVKVHVRNKRALADGFDQIGNLLCGMQADWATIGPLLRKGYLAMQLHEPKADVEDAAA